MPAQIPRQMSPVAGSVISDPDMRAMIMSMPGAMPSSIRPTIVPVKSSGWVPWLTVSPLTSSPSETWPRGNAAGQSEAAAAIGAAAPAAGASAGEALATPDTAPASKPQVASRDRAVRDCQRGNPGGDDEDMWFLPDTDRPAVSPG